MKTHRGSRDLSLPFNWRAELRGFGSGCLWILGIMLAWRVALFIAQI